MDLISTLKLLATEDIGVHGEAENVVVRSHRYSEGIIFLVVGGEKIAVKHIGESSLKLLEYDTILEVPSWLLYNVNRINIELLNKVLWT